MSAAVDHYYSLRPTDFHDLIRFEITRDREEIHLEIELVAKEVSNSAVLRLTFRNVSGLKYSPGFWSFAAITVMDFSPDGNFLFRVFEAEQDTEFSLYCEDFAAEIVPAPG